MSPLPLQATPALEPLTALVREVAQAVILPPFGRAQAHAKDDGSLITEVDLAVQQRLITALAELTPGIPVLGEEMTPDEQRQLLETADFWALDPLDGTGNYASGFPFFAVSLALWRAGQVELGVIYDPVRDECFSARCGQGAWLNGAPLRGQSGCEQLADAMALIDFKRIPPQRVPALLRKGAFRSQRNLGSVALDWCWLAAGRAQVYLHGGQRLWDYAAGQLIAAEAGVVRRLLQPGRIESGETPTLEPRLALAAVNQALFEQWWQHVELPWHD
ncbi:inositol monophosphatase family protein [Rhabdochromatium marinum]|uniref:inositol monophosphatase family protein n=1 Tax=Rhabdochromatium marinum TaxID=48729 RepID=UPI001906368D|nr:inositol monophosphatase [Rhabdochromatium marinum]MBK1650055.1 inositol monophosphatase [Rhabdochromatium marinum]